MDNQQSQSFRQKTDYTVDVPKSDSPQADGQSSAGGLGGMGDKLSSVAGGDTGDTGGTEDNQSYLDKGISYLQQSITGKSGQTNETSEQGDTSHHAAVDAAHPDKISEFLRDQNGSMTKNEDE